MNAPSVDEERLGDLANAYAAAWCSQDAARVASFFDEAGSLCVNEGAPAVGAFCHRRCRAGIHDRLSRYAGLL
jgi:hypothetical protein